MSTQYDFWLCGEQFFCEWIFVSGGKRLRLYHRHWSLSGRGVDLPNAVRSLLREAIDVARDFDNPTEELSNQSRRLRDFCLVVRDANATPSPGAPT